MITENQKRFILTMLENWVSCHRLVSAKLDIDNYLVELMPKKDSMGREQFLGECYKQKQLVIEKHGCEKVSQILNRKISHLNDLSFSEVKKVIDTLKNEHLDGMDWFRRYPNYDFNSCGQLEPDRFNFKVKK